MTHMTLGNSMQIPEIAVVISTIEDIRHSPLAGADRPQERSVKVPPCLLMGANDDDLGVI